MKVGIFFPFYGSKFQWGLRYPDPTRKSIVEPFAGAAGYSLRHHEADVRLNDADPIIAGVWDYLIHSSVQEVRNLPLLDAGDDVRELAVCQEARWLIGFWANPGSATPKNVMSSFAKYPVGHPQYRATRSWGPTIRERIARQKPLIEHWTITCGDYHDLPPDELSTWFIDPPYQDAGRHYKVGLTDYHRLAEWVLCRLGPVVVCESTAATWLPFEPLFETHTAIGSGPKRRYSEGIYLDEGQSSG